MKEQVINTEQFRLVIVRGMSSTLYKYQPNGYWAEPITGTIRQQYNEYIADYSNSSGGTDRTWTLDNALDFAAAIQDCVKRLKEDFETEKIRMESEQAEFLESERKKQAQMAAKEEKLSADNPPLDQDFISPIVKDLFAKVVAGETVQCEGKFVKNGDIQTFLFDNGGTKRFHLGGSILTSQKSLVEALLKKKIVALKIL